MTNSEYMDGYTLAAAGVPLDPHRAERSPSYASGWHDCQEDAGAAPASDTTPTYAPGSGEYNDMMYGEY